MLIDFIQNLVAVPFQQNGPATFGQTGLLLEGSNAQLSSFLSQYSKNKQWSSWTHFIDEWRRFSGYATANPTVTAYSGPAFTSLVADFKAALNITASGGDLVHYKNSFASAAEFDAKVEEMAANFMTQALSDFPFPADGSAVTSALFFSYLQEALTATAYILNATSGASNVASYERVYNSLFSTGFQQKIAAFISSKVENHGFFTPGVFYNDWTEEITAEFKATQNEKLTPDEIAKRQITMTVYDMLIDMLSLLQESVSSQTEIVYYLSIWQKEFSLCMQNTPIYVQNPANYAGITLSSLPTLTQNALTVDPSITAAAFYRWYQNFHDPYYADDVQADAYDSSHRGAYINFTDTNWDGISASGGGGSIHPISYGYQYFYNDGQHGNHGLANLGYLSDPDRRYYGPAAYGSNLRGNSFVVRQRWQGSSDTDINRRSSKNQVLNQFVEDQRGKRSAVSDKQEQQQNAIQNTNNSMNQISDLMTAVMQQMSTMLQAVFR